MLLLRHNLPEHPYRQGEMLRRPPGTESMSGHIDDGSETGACGNGGCGFRTVYLPWIDCPECLVLLDWGLDIGLFAGGTNGIFQVQSPEEIAAEKAAETRARERLYASMDAEFSEDDSNPFDDDYGP